MTRPLRIEYEDAIYHVMNRGLSRHDIFHETDDYEEFLKVIAEANSHWKIEVYGYCLMRNHYHICVGTPRANISRVMRHIDGVYTQRYNRAHHADGPLFRGRYKAIIIDAHEYLGAVVRYIHLNPVKAKLVEKPQEYAWSSHRHYLKTERAPQWLKTKELLESFGGPKGFHEYVIQGNEQEIEKFYGSKKQSAILGGKDFVKKVKEREDGPHQEHTRDEGRYLRPQFEELLEVIESYYKVGKIKIENGTRGQENEARRVAIYLAYEICDLKQREIAVKFKLTHPGTVGWHCMRMRKEITRDAGLKKRVGAISVLINRVTLQHEI